LLMGNLGLELNSLTIFLGTLASLISSAKKLPKSHSSIEAESVIFLTKRFRTGLMKTRLCYERQYWINKWISSTIC